MKRPQPQPRNGAERDDLEKLATTLARVLNDAVGMNVRQPSSNVPPFRAQQWEFSVNVQILSGNSSAIAIDFQGQTAGALIAVPRGLRGVCAYVHLHVYPDDVGAIPATEFYPRLTLNRNGNQIPGYVGMAPGFTYQESVTDAAGAELAGASLPGPRVLVPVKLQPGDRMTATVGPNNSGVNVRAAFAVSGWFYPIEVQADNVVGTIADRGNLEGLVRRT